MTNKKIIIILTLVVLILAVFLLILNGQLLPKPSLPAQTEPSVTIVPTGILIPTRSISPGVLDIVKVYPLDHDENVATDTKIEITFSKPFDQKDVVFSIGPAVPYTQEIKENKLIVTLQKPLATGTLYTHTIDFSADKQKIRVYRFTTKGSPGAFIPDTYPATLIKQEEEYEKTNFPDIHVANNSPFESSTFLITSVFENSPTAHFSLRIKPKIADTERVRQDVDVWLQNLDLTSEQINILDIRYE